MCDIVYLFSVLSLLLIKLMISKLQHYWAGLGRESSQSSWFPWIFFWGVKIFVIFYFINWKAWTSSAFPHREDAFDHFSFTMKKYKRGWDRLKIICWSKLGWKKKCLQKDGCNRIHFRNSALFTRTHNLWWFDYRKRVQRNLFYGYIQKGFPAGNQISKEVLNHK